MPRGESRLKVDDPPRFRVSKWSMKKCDAEDMEKWMNEINPDYILDHHFQQDDDLVLILRHWPRRRSLRSNPKRTVTKKKVIKKEATKK